MKVLKGMFTICCENAKGVIPTAKQLARCDRRIIYLGDVKTSNGEELKDAFVFTLDPLDVMTIKDAEVKEDLVFLDVEYHTLSRYNPVIKKMFSEHYKETYIGTVYVDTAAIGRVYKYVYETYLGSNVLYQKGRDGSINFLPLNKVNLSYPDRFRWRLVEIIDRKKYYYAFLWGVDAYNKWLSISKRNTKVFHNFSPSIESISDNEVRNGMMKYPVSTQKLFEKNYSTAGFLELK